MIETYTMTVGPDFTVAYFGRGDHFACLDEWTGRSVQEFAAGMEGRGFQYHAETTTIGTRTTTEHTWTRRA